MLIGYRGLMLIKEYEKLRLKAYKPTPDDVWTIGYGHTKGVKPGDVISPEYADILFAQDVAEKTKGFGNLIAVPLTQSMYDALISLCFNCGVGVVHYGTTIGDALRSKDYYDACAGFMLWRKQTNRKTGKRENVLGLARRRAREMSLFWEDGEV